jgi:hypothetical protein
VAAAAAADCVSAAMVKKNERGLGKGSLSLSLSLFLANIQKRQKGLKKGRFAAGSRTTTIQ